MSNKNKDVLSVAGMLGGLALLSMNNKTTKVYESDPPTPSYVPPPPSPPRSPPPPPSPPKSAVTLSIDKTIIREDEIALAFIDIDSYPYNTSQGLDVSLIYDEYYLVGFDTGHIPPGFVKFPINAGFTIHEMVYPEPAFPERYKYMVSLPIGTHNVMAAVSSYGQPAVYSNIVTMVRTPNGYLYDAHLLDAYRNENGNIVLSLDVNADPNTYMIAFIQYLYPRDFINPKDIGVAMDYRLIGGGTYTIVGPVPFEQYEKMRAVNVVVNHPGDKIITTETLYV
ncbi:MAG: hypothetical protein ACP5HH_07190 [Fervidicoccaceae archaeon]